MGRASLRLTGGVNQNKTEALNEAAISFSNLIRFFPDGSGGILPQKIGGWSKFFPNTIAAVVRALWGWEDTNAVTHLAFGTQNIGMTNQAELGVITNNVEQDITPRSQTDNIAPVVTTVAGNSIVTITDTTITNITNYDTVYIPVHISIGGLILFGMYVCDPNGFSSATAYTVNAVDTLGNNLPAPSSSSSPTVAVFDTTIGLSTVTVTLADHGYVAESTYPILVAVTVGGVTLLGNYIVQSVSSTSQFVVATTSIATSTATATINGGNAQYIYSFGVGAIGAGTGYGIGGYGTGGYGTGTSITPTLGTPISARDWTLDNWGEILISCPISTPPANTVDFAPVYEWTPTNGSPTATVIPASPVVNDGVFVAMPQRQIVAWGSTETGVQDPLLIRWCDVNNFNVWIGMPTNQAGSYRIPRGSRIVAGIQGPQQGLIWTDIGLWAMQYTGLPYVYSFNEIGSGCGLIGRKAAASINGIIYWMGPSQFFSLSGDGVSIVVCPVWDVIFQNLDKDNVNKIRIAVNSRFNEIAWYYPTLTSNGEVAAYVKYNVLLEVWDFGNLARSAWIDQSVLGSPIGADPNSLYIYQHEASKDADGAAINASFQTGYFAINEGDNKTFVDQVWPDMKWGYYDGTQSATVNMTFYVTDYPGDTPLVFGPYAVAQSTQFFNPRFRGRLVSIAVSSNDTGSWWRLGNIRYRFTADGKY